MALPPGFIEVREQTPEALIPATTKKSFAPTRQEVWITSYLLRVRSLGTASYIGIGDKYSQEYRLTVVGQVKGWSGSPDELMNLHELYYISDAADAVIELVATYRDRD